MILMIMKTSVKALQAKRQQGAVTHQRVARQVDDLQRCERMQIWYLLQSVTFQEKAPQPWTQACQSVLRHLEDSQSFKTIFRIL